VSDAGWATLNAADAIIMGSPTYMGSVSWQFKKVCRRLQQALVHPGLEDKVFAGFTNSATMNGDKLSTLHYLFTLAMQQGGIWVGTGLMPSNSKAAQRDDVNYVGSFSGAMAQSPSDASPAEMLPGDLETARLFGQRVAEVAARFKQTGTAQFFASHWVRGAWLVAKSGVFQLLHPRSCFAPSNPVLLSSPLPFRH
jgi:NAD(P)H dehydrogenase (quinone)